MRQKRRKKKSRVGWIVLAVVCILAVAGFFAGKSEFWKSKPTIADKIEKPKPEAPKLYGPLTGRVIMDPSILEKRPIAIMLDNEKRARPQTGLYQADIVYEYPAEGGITRYMAIYLEKSPDVVGPVRSARPYFIDKSFDFDATYVHCGGSNQAFEDIKRLNVMDINEMWMQKGIFWRDKTRRAPHNLYTRIANLRTYMEQKNWNDAKTKDYFQFSKDKVYTPSEGTDCTGLKLSYMKNYQVGYEYNPQDGLYYRSINGERLLDRYDKTPVTATNVILEDITMRVLDDKGRLEVGTVGSGTGKLFTAGKVMDIQWHKDSRKSRTVYQDMQGKEITVNAGVTFIQGVPKTVKLTMTVPETTAESGNTAEGAKDK